MSLDVKQLESTSAGAENTANVITAFTSLGKSDTTGDNRAAVTAADISSPFVLPEAEETRLVAALRAAADAASNPAVARADRFWLLAAIRARKGDVPRALALAANYVQWRASIGADHLNLAKSEKMRAQLRRRIIFVAGNADREGRPIFNVRLRNQDPSSFAAVDSVRMISFVLEWTLRTFPAAQTHGVIMLNDMAGVGLHNLDLRMPGIMQKAFSKTVPVRLSAFNMVHPPLFFRVVFPLVKNILSHKMKARIRIFPAGEEHRLHEFVAPDQLPDDIQGADGTFSWTTEQHEAWIQRMIDDCQTWSTMSSFNEGS